MKLPDFAFSVRNLSFSIIPFYIHVIQDMKMLLETHEKHPIFGFAARLASCLFTFLGRTRGGNRNLLLCVKQKC